MHGHVLCLDAGGGVRSNAGIGNVAFPDHADFVFSPSYTLLRLPFAAFHLLAVCMSVLEDWHLRVQLKSM